jgi:hypothetical protein
MSQPYVNPDGVAFGTCHYCGYCERFGCEVNAKASAHFTVIPLAAQKNNVEMRTNARVMKVNLDTAKTRAESVTYIDAAGREFEQPGDLVVLCAYALGNVHLMLLSGIGKPYNPATGDGVIGRNYAYQIGSGATVFFDEKTWMNPFMGAGALAVNIDDFNTGSFDHAKEGFIGGGGISTPSAGGRPIGFRPVPPGTPAWGTEWKRAVVRHYNHALAINNQGSVMAYRQNYLDLEDLRVRLVSWQTSFDAFDDIIALRKQNYEPLLPEFDAQFRELDAQIRLRMEQRKHLEKRLHDMLTAPRPDYLATADERIVAERLDQLEKQLDGADDPRAQQLRERMAHVQGVLTWRWRTEYHERLTQAYEDLEELNTTIATMAERYESLVRTRQAATHSYVGYDVPISRLRTRVSAALERVTLLMARQGHLLETVAITELQARRDRLDSYQSQARFAVADSYDRAARAQAGEEEKR